MSSAAPKLLIVDDEVNLRFAVRRYFAALGYDVCEADSAAAAARVFDEERPDVVLLDVRLPDGNGLEVFRGLRLRDASLPVVFLTGHGSIEAAVQAIQEGAEQFLTKPVELAALRPLVERLVETVRSRRVGAAQRSREARRALDPFLGESPSIR